MVFESKTEIDGSFVLSLWSLWSLSSLPKNSSASGFRGGKSALELQERKRRRGDEPVLTETLRLRDRRPRLDSPSHSGTTSR
jgi:hypothetical protein